MFNIPKAIEVLHTNASIISANNLSRFKQGLDQKLKYGKSQCAHYVKIAISSAEGGALPLKNSGINSAKDYGPCLIENGFHAVDGAMSAHIAGVYSITGQQAGDVVVVQSAPNHPDGHMAMFDGTQWVSDFVQPKGFYPAAIYRTNSISFVLYRYGDAQDAPPPAENKTDNKDLHICYPITKNAKGDEFGNSEEILSHIEKEPAGLYLVGRNGMWHGGIHISSVTTPWCALSGNGASESTDFPTPYKGGQSLRCMADGEVVAYRICKDYLHAPWPSGELSYSGSFVLIRHYLQPGEDKKSSLTFYTLYMHLAPWSAYQGKKGETSWKINEKNGLSAYEDADRTVRKGTLPKGTKVRWDENDEGYKTQTDKGRIYGNVTLDQDVIVKAHGQTPEKKLFSKGELVWVLADRDNLKTTESVVIPPAWWAHFLPPSKETLEYDKVVCPNPLRINAKDPVGHLGYYQNPVSMGYIPRYQAHIECLSVDENLPTFLTNPDKVERDKPLYLKYSPGLLRYNKDLSTGKFVKETQVTRSTGIATLSKIKPASGPVDGTNPAETYYQIYPETAWLAKSSVKLLSRYDLGDLGFTLTDDSPQSFDKLEGKIPPESLIKKILDILHHDSQQDMRIDYALMQTNYKRLIDMLSAKPESYSPEEYRQAIHNPHMRDSLFRIIAKHPSEWYFKPADSLWQTFLKNLAKDQPEWKAYNETAIKKLGWIQDLDKSKVALGPSLWHMHPIVFLNMMSSKGRFSYKYSNYNITLDDALDTQLKLGNNGGPTMQKGGGFPRISKEEIRPYFDPEIHLEEPDIFQYLDISMPVSVTEEQMRAYLSNKNILSGHEATFLNAAQKYGVNAIYLAVHASLETGNGKSPLGTGIIVDGVKVYNMYGIGALDGKAVVTGSNMAKKMGWTTPEKAIDGGASWIASHYILAKQNTLYKMRWNPENPGTHQYATAANWALAQSKSLKRECDLFPEVTLPLDIPVYKK
ncbi:N-acetylglucosaminidase [Rahnella sp. AA]|uniref:N-acetylglucosaminidase n=1 Tax=Rahnella sp. AA TaxID=2057180 RepID=UPI0012FF4B8B|nr:N-acetylglucosaminidase [Rahnella sp. AA]